MLEKLRKLNPEIEFFSVKDDEFKKYGQVLNIDTAEIVAACEKIAMPESGSAYEPSTAALEELSCADELREVAMGGCKTQIGFCWGHSTMMNALEWHKNSEINVAATDLVLILGLEYEMEGSEYSADKAKAFFVEKGTAVEVYGTSMHFCPCQTSDEGFRCVVVLPELTNTVLEKPSKDKLLFKTNKWLICHDKNDGLIEKGVYPGIHGVNYEIKY